MDVQKLTQKKSYQTHFTFSTERYKHGCPKCAKSFTSEHNLQRHIQFHSVNKPVPCDHCSETFATFLDLKSHVKRLHPETIIFNCEICPRTFHLLPDLRDHLKTHTNISIFNCSQCDKPFQSKISYDNHVKQHDTSIFFECCLCPKQFYKRDQLSIHEYVHQTELFRCDTCYQNFRSQLRFIYHSKNREYQEAIYYGNHSATLVDDKSFKEPYPCNLCSEAFKCRFQLDRHKEHHQVEDLSTLLMVNHITDDANSHSLSH